MVYDDIFYTVAYRRFSGTSYNSLFLSFGCFPSVLRIVIKACCLPHIAHATTVHVSTAHVTITHATTAHTAIVHDTIALATHSTYSITQASRVTAHLWR